MYSDVRLPSSSMPLRVVFMTRVNRPFCTVPTFSRKPFWRSSGTYSATWLELRLVLDMRWVLRVPSRAASKISAMMSYRSRLRLEIVSNDVHQPKQENAETTQ